MEFFQKVYCLSSLFSEWQTGCILCGFIYQLKKPLKPGNNHMTISAAL